MQKRSSKTDLFINHILPMTLKFGVLVFLFLKYGIVKGIFIFVISFLTYLYSVRALLGYTKINGVETCIFHDDPNNRFTLIGICVISNFDQDKMKELLEDAIRKIPRLHEKIVNFLCEYYWKKVPLSESLKRVRTPKETLKTVDDVYQYALDELNKPFDIFNELPFEFILLKYGESSGALLVKFDHILSDGLGGISLICALASNNNINLYPKVMQSTSRVNVPIYLYIWNVLLFPYYFVVNFWYLFKPNFSNTPFRDRSKSKNIARFGKSKEYPLNIFKDLRAKYKVTFNDVVISVLSLAMNKLMKMKPSKDYDNNHPMKILVPYGIKRLPLSIEEVELRTDSYAFMGFVPLIDNLRKMKGISNKLKNSIKNFNLILNLKMSLDFICWLFSYKGIGIFWALFNKQCDMGISNIPGPSSKLIFGENMVVEDLAALCTSARAMPYVPLVSYNGQFKFCVTIDECIDVTPKEYIDIIQDIIENTDKYE